VEALLPTVLAGVAITELPEFIATQYFPGKQLEPILTDWRLPEGGLYFVTPTARARPAKVSALADFFIAKLGAAEWSAEAHGLEATEPPQKIGRTSISPG
jgi:DNA-binding transcriptional LysR family regulator